MPGTQRNLRLDLLKRIAYALEVTADVDYDQEVFKQIYELYDAFIRYLNYKPIISDNDGVLFVNSKNFFPQLPLYFSFELKDKPHSTAVMSHNSDNSYTLRLLILDEPAPEIDTGPFLARRMLKLKRLFLHEMVHYFDFRRYATLRPTYKPEDFGTPKYFNDPVENNAFVITVLQYLHEALSDLRSGKVDRNPILRQKYLKTISKNFNDFVTKHIDPMTKDTKDIRRDYINMLKPPRMRRLKNRLYLLHKAVTDLLYPKSEKPKFPDSKRTLHAIGTMTHQRSTL